MVPLITDREVALQMLMERLRWPVKMVRWRTAKEIRSLLVNDATRAATTNALLAWLRTRQLESEAISGLSVLVLAPADVRPSFEALRDSITCPSMASDFLINEMCGRRTERWISAHSGCVPEDFSAETYFEDHKTAHVPPVLSHELEFLEKRTGLPFLRQWAFEWTNLRNRLNAKYTRYPNYFGDFGLQRQGIVGQFVQRQGELYRSAYQRALACAVDQWNVPLRAVAPFAAYGLPVLPDLFEIEPTPRPQWLPGIDVALIGENDLRTLARDLLSREPVDDFQTVLLRIPLDRSLDEFGELELAAYFVSEDFELGENQLLVHGLQMLELDRYQFDMARPALRPREENGKAGTALPVCCDEHPTIHGYWHDEYYQRGLALPAPYCFDSLTFQRARPEGISVSIGGEQVGSLSIWHDAWTPMYAPNAATRCGCITRIERNRLASAAARLEKELGWFVRLSRMQKPEGGHDREPKETTAFVRL